MSEHLAGRTNHAGRRALRAGAIGLGSCAIGLLASPISGVAQISLGCTTRQAGVICGPGGGRTTLGGAGTGKVPHNDGAGRSWPAVDGILWEVTDATGRSETGTPFNDELLGHGGSDDLAGGAGNDIIWGDWDPTGNYSTQRDVLSGGPGDDWLYTSHGHNTVLGGPGNDYVGAYYGTGTIDCGPGFDTVRIRTNGAYTTRNCERVEHFCTFGQDDKGDCLSPTGKPVITNRRR